MNLRNGLNQNITQKYHYFSFLIFNFTEFLQIIDRKGWRSNALFFSVKKIIEIPCRRP